VDKPPRKGRGGVSGGVLLARIEWLGKQGRGGDKVFAAGVSRETGICRGGWLWSGRKKNAGDARGAM